jgi:hypothetical protein
MTEFKKGDRVRVTFDGAVTDAPTFVKRLRVTTDDHKYGVRGSLAWVEVEHVEKIEPPVEVFKPGDRLRRKGWEGAYEITLGSEGYLQHLTSGGVSYSTYTASPREFFNSENFDKVDLG